MRLIIFVSNNDVPHELLRVVIREGLFSFDIEVPNTGQHALSWPYVTHSGSIQAIIKLLDFGVFSRNVVLPVLQKNSIFFR